MADVFYTQVYVDLDNGNDSNDGSEGSPFLTLQRACNEQPATGGLVINTTGSVTDQPTLNLESANPVTLTNPVTIRQWVGQSRPTIDMLADNMFQTDNTMDGMSLDSLNISFRGTLSSNAFNINTGPSSAHNVWYNCIIEMDEVSSNSTAIHVAQQGKAIGNAVLNARNGIQAYSAGFIYGNFISFKRYGLLLQTTGYSANNFLLGLPSDDPIACIYMQNHSIASINNICYDPTGTFPFVRPVADRRGITFIGNYAEGFTSGFQGGDSKMNVMKNNTMINCGDVYSNNMDPYFNNATTGNETVNSSDPNASYLFKQDNGMIDAIDMRKWFDVLTRDVIEQAGLMKEIASIEELSGAKFPRAAKATVFGTPAKTESINPPYFN
jgi:hypothetical protein